MSNLTRFAARNLASGRSHKCRLTWNIAARCSCFSVVLERGLGAGVSVVLSGLEQLFSSIHFTLPTLIVFFFYSPFHWSNQCWRVPGMEAHGWVTGICQPWGLYSIWGLAGHSGSPWIPQAPTLHLSEAVVKRGAGMIWEQVLSKWLRLRSWSEYFQYKAKIKAISISLSCFLSSASWIWHHKRATYLCTPYQCSGLFHYNCSTGPSCLKAG